MSATDSLDVLDLRQKELEHRVKNLITIVRWVVMRSLEDSTSVEQARAAIEERLGSLEGAINQLLSSDWRAASLPELAEQALNHFASHFDRIRVQGEHVGVGAKAAMTLALALNELATNAIKYGALSSPTGVVDLIWKSVETEAGPAIWMQWAERAGPPVIPPERRGFGTRLICTAVSRSLRGRADLDFLKTGVVWTLFAPIEGMAR